MKLEVTTTIDRPVSLVTSTRCNPIENDLRWDLSLELEAISDGPIGVDSVIQRHVTRFGSTTGGSME